MKKKHIFIIILSLLAALLLSAAVAGFALYFQSARNGEAVIEVLPPPGNLELGKKFELKLKLNQPWAQSITDTVFTPAEGFIASGKMSTAEKKYSLHGTEHILAIPVKAYLTGELPPGSVAVTLERPFYRHGTSKITLSKKINKVQISAIASETSRELPLAGDIEKPQKTFWTPLRIIIAAAAGIILLAIIIFISLKAHRKQTPETPVWITSLQDLSELKKFADSGERPLVWCVARLTDVVRKYLTKRFCWPAEQQTTEEFFASIKGKKTPLTTTQLNYLEDFMKSADLIKFANIKPERHSFDQALNNAEDLIRETAESNDFSASKTKEANS